MSGPSLVGFLADPLFLVIAGGAVAVLAAEIITTWAERKRRFDCVKIMFDKRHK